MCDFLLRLWVVVLWCVNLHDPFDVIEMPVYRRWDSSTSADILGDVGKGLRGDGAGRWLGGFDRPPSLRRFGGLGVIDVHVKVSRFIDDDGRA